MEFFEEINKVSKKIFQIIKNVDECNDDTFISSNKMDICGYVSFELQHQDKVHIQIWEDKESLFIKHKSPMIDGFITIEKIETANDVITFIKDKLNSIINHYEVMLEDI